MRRLALPVSVLVWLIFSSVQLRGQIIQNVSVADTLVAHAEQAYRASATRPFPYGKCGLGLSFDIARNWKNFSEPERRLFHLLLSPAASQKDRIIGHFHFYYDTTGSDAAQVVRIDSNNACQDLPGTSEDFVDSAGVYFNQAWSYEIDTLGYIPPPVDTDGFYRVNIRNVDSFGEYGQTTFIDPPIYNGTPPRYSTFIDVDNDFCNVYPPSRGIAGLKVTAAHEFHHAIQIGSYGVWPSDFYYYEITSVWMEGVVHPEVKDYLQYIKRDQPPPLPPVPLGQFAMPDVSFVAFSGLIQYSRGIWGRFVSKKYGRDLMRRSWDYMMHEPSLPAIDHALNDAGSSFRQAFLEWTIWNLHTYTDADTVNYYSEGLDFPPIATRDPISFAHTPRSFTDAIDALSSCYHPICLLASPSDNCSVSPQMLAIVSNINAASRTGHFGFTYDLTEGDDPSFKKLSNGISVKLDVPDPENWATQESVPAVITDVIVSPDPFTPRGNKPLRFHLPSGSPTAATLDVFSSSMNRIISIELPVSAQKLSEPSIDWDGHDEYGNLVTSGIYFFVVTVGDKQYNGKFAVVRQ